MRLKKRTVYLLALHLLILDHVTKQVCISYLKNIHLTSLYVLFSTFHVVDPSYLLHIIANEVGESTHS